MKKQAEAAAAAVPEPVENVKIPAAVQQAIHDDKDESEETISTKRISADKKRRERDVQAEARKNQTYPKASQFDSASIVLPNFDNYGVNNDKSGELES